MSPDFERLVGRAILDPDFRKRLLDDPDGTVKGAGFSITDTELEQIREAAQDRAATDQKLDGLSVRATWG
ncbi:MAG TPA: Franean1_4349 family RiPP [Chloroflexaceae bacterium]|nr:Franean1_4349 family RiPP [Chloroflexaceae bacterium]